MKIHLPPSPLRFCCTTTITSQQRTAPITTCDDPGVLQGVFSVPAVSAFTTIFRVSSSSASGRDANIVAIALNVSRPHVHLYVFACDK